MSPIGPIVAQVARPAALGRVCRPRSGREVRSRCQNYPSFHQFRENEAKVEDSRGQGEPKLSSPPKTRTQPASALLTPGNSNPTSDHRPREDKPNRSSNRAGFAPTCPGKEEPNLVDRPDARSNTKPSADLVGRSSVANSKPTALPSKNSKPTLMTRPEKLEANGTSPDERADEARSGYLLSCKGRAINRVSGRSIRTNRSPPATGSGPCPASTSQRCRPRSRRC